MTKTTDPSQAPDSPQYQLGATSDEAAMANQIAHSKVGGPGDIVARLGNQQWQFPRAEPDASMSRDHGTPYG